MTDKNHEDQNRPNDALDRVLDAALSKYVSIEPRAGLEDRILANLRAERPAVERGWWRWGLAGAVAAVVLIALAVALRSGRTTPPEIVKRPPVFAPSPSQPDRQRANRDAVAMSPPHHPTVHKRARSVRAHEVVEAATPRLNVFPSPQPLSSEELALAQYVRDFPQEAVLIAQSQKESEMEMQKKMGKTEVMNSEEQER